MLHRRNLAVRWLAVLAVWIAGWADAPAFQRDPASAEEWIARLESPERLAGLHIDQILARLNLKPGNIVADIGAGSGVFSRALAGAVGPKGKVFAVDVQQGLLDYINQRAKQQKIANIQTVLGQSDRPNLPSCEVDLAFFHVVLHEIERPAAYLKALSSCLKPTGRIAIIDVADDDPKALAFEETLEMLISKEEAKKMLSAVGFHPVEDFDLPVEEYNLFGVKKWFVIFARR